MEHSINNQKGRFLQLQHSSSMKRLEGVLGSSLFTLACLLVLLLPLAVALLFSVAYSISFLYGICSGQPFPSREVFLFFPALGPVFSQPHALGKSLLAYAFAGFILSSLLQRKQQPDFARRCLAALGRHWNTVSFLMIFSLLLATLGVAYYAYNSHNSALAGIMPYSDANGHYSHYTKYFYDGIMGEWVLRRPMAAFMGASLHWLAGNDPASALLIRCLLVSCAMWASCAVMNKSFGVWSAIGCLALEYTYVSEYLPTFLTESLGFFWGCTAVALWLQALREKRLFWDLAAFSVTLVGLLVRMGTMFLVPLLFLYVLWRWRGLHPGHGWWKKPLLGLLLCTVAVALFNGIFAARGQGDSQQTGSNFSYSFAGLTLGTDWSAAKKLYINQLRALKDEKQRSRFLYKQGMKNLLASPGVFVKRLAAGEGEFLKNIDFFLFHKWYLVGLVGVLLVLRRKTLFSKSTAVFWCAVWCAILLSIPFIYFDQSWRVNIFVYPFIAWFVSLALGQPHEAPSWPNGRSLAAAPWLVVTLSCALLLLMTSVAIFPRFHTSGDIQRIQKYIAGLPKQPANRFLVDAKGMGFLVVPDGEEPDLSVPSMTWSTFRDRYQKFAPAVAEAFFTRDLPKPPFVVLNQIPLMGLPSAYGFFIVPPEVMTSKNVLLWDLEADSTVKDASIGLPWKIVASAKPVLYK